MKNLKVCNYFYFLLMSSKILQREFDRQLFLGYSLKPAIKRCLAYDLCLCLYLTM